jgi:hypothetical protein
MEGRMEGRETIGRMRDEGKGAVEKLCVHTFA